MILGVCIATFFGTTLFWWFLIATIQAYLWRRFGVCDAQGKRISWPRLLWLGMFWPFNVSIAD